MSELGGDHPLMAAAFDRLSDQALRQVVAIAFGCVDQVKAQRLPRIKNLFYFLLAEAFPPLSSVLPGTDSDHRNL